MYDFKAIKFGCIDAQVEGQDYPNLLKNGYINISQVVGTALETSKFLFLGYKGSGKSSLAEHLKLLDTDVYQVDAIDMKDLAYKSFYKIISGEAEREIKAIYAWRWLLLIKILDNLLHDADAHSLKKEEIERFSIWMVQQNIFPVRNFADLIKNTSTTSFKATLRNMEFAYSTGKENVEVSMMNLISYVKDLVASFKEGHKHIIIIDGLDEILTSRDIQYISIAALINEAKDLNRFFSVNDVPVKINILCRTDIFDRLPDPNKNKIRQDSSFSFTWYREGVNSSSDNELIRLVNVRAQMVYPEIQDVFAHFFPLDIHRTNIYTYLLDYTRHIPRDFIQLLNSIQGQCKASKITSEDIENGVNSYSVDYFVSEIRDEMAGYIPYAKIDYILSAIAGMRSREFKYEDFAEKYYAMSELQDVDINEVMRVLYDCSAIGHKYSFDGGRHTRVTFKYRNRNSSFNQSDVIFLHKGLWKALNVNY